MALKITKNYRPSYTLREIFEGENPELWNEVQALSKRLADLQEMLIPVMPLRQQQLPKDAGLMNEADAQTAFQSYILVRSLYAFADKSNRLLDSQCTSYAKALNAHDTYDEEDALADLKKTIDVLDDVPLKSLLDDRVSGLHRLSAVTYKFKGRMDFGVFELEKGSWTFHDIMGTIINQGLSDGNMLQDAINDIPPTSVSVTELLDNDEMQRMY
ncbi:MAG: hypothetical protein UHT92_05330 [Prevotella sp.]|nr:hypothetical protein [Prevotella sp.]